MVKRTPCKCESKGSIPFMSIGMQILIKHIYIGGSNLICDACSLWSKLSSSRAVLFIQVFFLVVFIMCKLYFLIFNSLVIFLVHSEVVYRFYRFAGFFFNGFWVLLEVTVVFLCRSLDIVLRKFLRFKFFNYCITQVRFFPKRLNMFYLSMIFAPVWYVLLILFLIFLIFLIVLLQILAFVLFLSFTCLILTIHVIIFFYELNKVVYRPVKDEIYPDQDESIYYDRQFCKFYKPWPLFNEFIDDFLPDFCLYLSDLRWSLLSRSLIIAYNLLQENKIYVFLGQPKGKVWTCICFFVLVLRRFYKFSFLLLFFFHPKYKKNEL